MKILTTMILFSGWIMMAGAQVPWWASEEAREKNFPRESFYVGYAKQETDRRSDINLLKKGAEQTAIVELLSKIKAVIKIEIDNYKTENTNTVDKRLRYEIIARLQDKVNIQSQDSIEDLQKMETVYDRDNNLVYAMVYLDKKQMALKLHNCISKTLLTLDGLLAQAKYFTSQSMIIDALQQLAEATAIFPEFELTQGKLATITGEYYKWNEYMKTRSEVAQLNAQISEMKSLDIITTCRMIIDGLVQKRGIFLKYPVVMKNICFEETNEVSPFSMSLNREFIGLIADHFSLEPMSGEIKDKPHTVFAGSYSIADSSIRVHARITGFSIPGIPDGTVLATNAGFVSRNWLDDNFIEYFPPTILNALKIRDELESEVKQNPADFMVLAVPDKPVFHEGEKLSLYVRTVRPGYLRILYYTADNKTNLFLDNYYIGPDSVNLWIDLDKNKQFRLVFAGPAFGEENLLVAWSSGLHPPLNTTIDHVTINGISTSVLVVDDDPVTATRITRSGANKYKVPLHSRYSQNPVGSFYFDKSFFLRVEPKDH